MAKSKANDGYSTQAARELLEDARPKREALAASQKALRAEFEEQRRVEKLEHSLLGKGGYLEQEEHSQRYHDAFKRSRELEVLLHREVRKRPGVDPALVKAARLELQDDYISYLERVCVLYEQIEAETRRYYQAADVAAEAGGIVHDHLRDEARETFKAVKKITNLLPDAKFPATDKACLTKSCLQRAKQYREKIAG